MKLEQYRIPSQVFDLFVGKPASGKSEAIARLIEYLWHTTGKKSRLILGDGSYLSYEHLIEKGIVDYVEFPQRPYPSKTLVRLAEGWFPQDRNPHGSLVPPTSESLEPYILCAFEGLSVAGKYIMSMVQGGLAERAAKGEKLGPDPAVSYFDGDIDPKTGKKSDDGMSFGTSGTAHYMQTQALLTELVQRTRGLPFKYVLWTAHETVSEQQTNLGDLKNPIKVKTGETIIGPEAGGKALTPVIQRLFNNMLHFQAVAKARETNLDLEYRLWTRDHFAVDNASKLRYIACTRGVGKQFPPFFTNEEPGMNLLDFYTKFCEHRDAKLTLD